MKLPLNEEYYISREIRQGQDLRYAVDDTKLTSLGWYPQRNFDEELPAIVDYYTNKFIW
jgi:dTDP-D-glucose 4,6-dehydratase